MKLRNLLSLLSLILILLVVGLHASSNRPPQASFSYSALSRGAELTVNTIVVFDGSDSSDSDGRIVKYEWDFDGDGVYDRASVSPGIEWLYDEGGHYGATLRVTDDDGAMNVGEREIDVENAPVAVRQIINTTIKPNKALAGDPIQVTVELNFLSKVDAPAIQPELPEGWQRVREIESGGLQFKQTRDELVWVWVGEGLLSGDRLRIIYEVQVPSGAEHDLYRIRGFVSGYAVNSSSELQRFEIPIPKEVEVQVM